MRDQVRNLQHVLTRTPTLRWPMPLSRRRHPLLARSRYASVCVGHRAHEAPLTESAPVRRDDQEDSSRAEATSSHNDA